MTLTDSTESKTEEFIVLREDKSQFHAEVSASNITNKEDNIIGLMASFVNITRRKKTEKELKKVMNNLIEANASKERFFFQLFLMT